MEEKISKKRAGYRGPLSEEGSFSHSDPINDASSLSNDRKRSMLHGEGGILHDGQGQIGRGMSLGNVSSFTMQTASASAPVMGFGGHAKRALKKVKRKIAKFFGFGKNENAPDAASLATTDEESASEAPAVPAAPAAVPSVAMPPVAVPPAAVEASAPSAPPSFAPPPPPAVMDASKPLAVPEEAPPPPPAEAPAVEEITKALAVPEEVPPPPPAEAPAVEEITKALAEPEEAPPLPPEEAPPLPPMEVPAVPNIAKAPVVSNAAPLVPPVAAPAANFMAPPPLVQNQVVQPMAQLPQQNLMDPFAMPNGNMNMGMGMDLGMPLGGIDGDMGFGMSMGGMNMGMGFGMGMDMGFGMPMNGMNMGMGMNFGMPMGFVMPQAPMSKSVKMANAVKAAKPIDEKTFNALSGKTNLTDNEFASLAKAQEGKGKEWASKLTPAELAATKFYTGNDYSGMNKHLRKQPLTPAEAAKVGEYEKQAKNLSAAIGKASTTADDTVSYRGVGDVYERIILKQLCKTPAEMAKVEKMSAQEVRQSLMQAYRDKKMVGKRFSDSGFTSTSIYKDKAEFFMNSQKKGGHAAHMMEFHAPKGSHAAYVEPVTAVTGEYELLYDRNQQYEIEEIKEIADEYGPGALKFVLRIIAEDKKGNAKAK